MGLRLVEADLCTATKCYLIDTRVASALVMRRDIVTQTYGDKLQEGAILHYKIRPRNPKVMRYISIPFSLRAFSIVLLASSAE